MAYYDEDVVDLIDRRTDPRGTEASADMVQILWSALVLVVYIGLVFPFLLVRWVYRRVARTREPQRPTHRRAEKEEPDVWRRGY